MSNLKVVISAPIDNNTYSLLVSHLCIEEPGVDITGVITLKTLSLIRIKSEYKRMGRLIFVKIINKFFVRNSSKALASLSNNNLNSSLNPRLKSKSLRRMAKRYSIPFIKVNNLNNNTTLNFLKKQKPDLILSIGSTIIRKPFLDIPSIGVLNVHMGVLPEYRGLGVTEWPLIESRVNEVGLGVTLHLIDEEVDTGPIIKKQIISIDGCQSLEDLESKYLNEMVGLMIEGVKMARDKKLLLQPQKNSEIDKGRQYYSTHKRMRLLAEKRLMASN